MRGGPTGKTKRKDYQRSRSPSEERGDEEGVTIKDRHDLEETTKEKMKGNTEVPNQKDKEADYPEDNSDLSKRRKQDTERRRATRSRTP